MSSLEDRLSYGRLDTIRGVARPLCKGGVLTVVWLKGLDVDVVFTAVEEDISD